MKRILSAITVILLATALCRSDASGQTLPVEVVLVNSPYPPYVMPEGDARGPGIDMEVAMKALNALGIKVVVQMVPFKRVLHMLEVGQADLTTTLSIRDDRDAYLLWSEPYRSGTPYLFFTRKDGPFIPSQLADLRGKTVGITRGFAYPPEFANDSSITKSEAPHHESLVGMLLQDRFDAIIINAIVGKYELIASGKIAEVRQAPFELSSVNDPGTVMGFSKARCDKELVVRFNAEIRQMLADGTIARIQRKYLQ